MKSSVAIDTIQHGHPLPTLPIVIPSWLPTDNLMCTAIYVVPNLTQRWKYFQPHSHERSKKNYLSWKTTPGWPELLDLLERWASELVLRGFRKWSPWLLRSLLFVFQTLIWALLTKSWLTICWSVCLLSPKSVSTWNTLYPSLDPRLVGTASPLFNEGTLKTLTWRPQHWAHGGSQRRPSIIPYTCWQLR